VKSKSDYFQFFGLFGTIFSTFVKNIMYQLILLFYDLLLPELFLSIF